MIISNFLSSEHWRMWLGFSVSLFFPDEKLEQHQEHSLTHGKQQTKSQGFFEASSAVPKTNALFVFALLSTHHCSSEVSLPSQCWTSAKSKDPNERDLGRHSPFSQVPKTCLRLKTSHYWGTFLKCWCFLLDGSGVPPPHSSCCNSQHFPTTVEWTSLPSAAPNCVPLHEHPNTMWVTSFMPIRVFQSTMPLCNRRALCPNEPLNTCSTA